VKRTCFTFLLALACLTASAQPQRILLLRHAEKPSDDNKATLSLRGQQRAKAVVSFLTQTPGLIDKDAQVVLFATHFGKKVRDNHTHETLAPLARQLHLKIQSPYENTSYAALARHVLKSPECKGKVVVVCWDHEHLSELAAALGVRPEAPKWKGSVFDRVWVLTPKNGAMQMEDLPQKLLHGDSKR